MISWTVYDTRNGRILRSGSASDLQTVYAQVREPFEDIMLFENWSFGTHYIVGGVAIARPTNPGFNKTEITADGSDAAILSLGTPFAAVIDGAPHSIADGVLEITSELPATYRVRVEAFPFLDYVAEIVAIPTSGG